MRCGHIDEKDTGSGSALDNFQILKSAQRGESKLYDLFLLAGWFNRKFCYLCMILPLDYSEILNISYGCRASYTSAHLSL